MLFIKETDIFGYIVVCTIYTSHIGHFTPQHTAFEHSTACLSLFLKLLPGLNIVCNIVTHWKKQLYELELQLSDYNM